LTGDRTLPVTSDDANATSSAFAAIVGAPLAVVQSVISGVEEQVRATVKPAAVAAVATTFSFPLVLMVLVLGFLTVQHRLDGRDPKFRSAPLTSADTTIAFTDEDAS